MQRFLKIINCLGISTLLIVSTVSPILSAPSLNEKAHLFVPEPSVSTSPFYYGRTLSSGDLNDDGYEDLVTADGRDSSIASNAGKIFVYFGGPEPDYEADWMITGETVNQYFPYYGSIATGDFNDDDIDDLVIGDFTYNSAQGRLLIFWGDSGNGGTVSGSSADLIKLGSGAADEKYFGFV